MAQTGFTPIQIYRSSTASAAPTSGNLVAGELAINTADGKLFYLDSLNAVQVIGWKLVPTTAGGTGLSSYTTGDTLYSSATNTLAKLPIGSTGQVLTVASGLPAWSSLPAQVYPAAGIPNSTGSAWGTSYGVTGSGSVVLSSSSAPSGAIVGISDTQTLTNKRITSRVSTTTSSATPTINTNTTDQYGLTAQAVDITSFTTNLSGTPTDGQKLWIYIVGTAARAITWGTSFEASTVALPTTTVTTNRLDVGFVWNAATSKWRCVAVA